MTPLLYVLLFIPLLLLTACGSKDRPVLYPPYADASDKSETCMEAVRAIAKRLRKEAETKSERRFATLRLGKLEEHPPTADNTACYEARVDKDGVIRLNGVYTTDMLLVKTMLHATHERSADYTYFRITSPPGDYPKSVIFPLLEKMEKLDLHVGLMTKYDSQLEAAAKSEFATPRHRR